MKKAFLLLIVAVALASTVWLKASAAGAASIKVTIYSDVFTDAKAGKHVPAKVNISETDWQELDCVTTERSGYVSCQFPTEYAGQQLPVALTKNGAMDVYIVDVPQNQ
jgi:hypothetical protein